MNNNNQDKNGFSYNYSAKEQAEVKRIRAKYAPLSDTEDKMARLRRLDASVTRAAETVALILGIIGALLLGFGMSLCMTELGAMLGFSVTVSLVVGIIFGVIGVSLVSFAYPTYNYIVKLKRKKLAPEIIRLTDELMK